LSIGRELPAAMVETVSLALGRGLTRNSDAIWFMSRGVVAEELDGGVLAAVNLGAMPLGAQSGSRAAPAHPQAKSCMR
jgi:LysR family pca operon transcriptional activator